MSMQIKLKNKGFSGERGSIKFKDGVAEVSKENEPEGKRIAKLFGYEIVEAKPKSNPKGKPKNDEPKDEVKTKKEDK